MSMVYYGLALNTGSLTGDAYVNASVSAALEFPAILLTHIMLRFLGRRALLSAGFVISGISLVAILAVPKGIALFCLVLLCSPNEYMKPGLKQCRFLHHCMGRFYITHQFCIMFISWIGTRTFRRRTFAQQDICSTDV